MSIDRFSVVGLGKLGACTAACIANKGFDVIGVDINPKTVALINEGRAPVMEPGLDESIAACRGRLTATSDYERAIMGSEATFVVVPTPSDDKGAFSLRYVAQAACEIGRALAKKSDYHIVVITSTVLPGSTEFGILPILERESGKVCGQGFGLCYNPEFIALGSVIRDFLNPDFVLIGQSDENAGSQLEAVYASICDNNPPVARMSFVNAELAKIALNTYVTTKITYANMLASICERLPGGDVDVVTAAIGLDSRIGKRYLKGGLGYGGPCFPRDNVALAYIAREVGCRALLAETTDQVNRSQVQRIARLILAHLRPGSRVAVLGLSYKPLSNVVEESQGLEIARSLAAAGCPTIVYDPLALDNARRELGDRVPYANTAEECLGEAEAVIIANADPEFVALPSEAFVRHSSPLLVLDAWRIKRAELAGTEGVEYLPFGVGDPSSAMAKRLADLWRQEEPR